jgi:uncharacterized protein YjgD (DUF1641 family)
MAKPISFIPNRVDPKHELQRRLAAAPDDHAEALLVAYDLLEEAHRQGVLDMLHGAIGAKDTIVGLLADYSVKPITVNAMRNLLALIQLLGAMDPEPLSKLSKQMVKSVEEHRMEKKPPTFWQLFKKLRKPESRRGISLLTSFVAAIGSSFDI